jgi:DNA primase
VSLRVPGSLAREYEEAVEKLYDRESTAEPKAALPDGFTKVSHYMKAWDYLLERGLTPSDIKYYGIGVGLQGKVSGRVIVPTFDDFGDVIFWTARSYTDSEIRYINPVGEIRKRALFDISRASREREIVVTEGVFSAMAVGRGAVATFGKLVTNEQVWLLVEAYRREHCGSIAVALDGDARSENHDLARRLTSFGCRVRVVDLPDDRDPADVGREDFSRLLAQAPRFSSLESIRSRAMAL